MADAASAARRSQLAGPSTALPRWLGKNCDQSSSINWLFLVNLG